MSSTSGGKVVLKYPRARLFTNCVLATPSHRAVYSISSHRNNPITNQPSYTTIFALSLSASQPNTPAQRDEPETSFFDDKSEINYREAEKALGKRIVAKIRWRGSERGVDDRLEVEIPNRGHPGSAAVGPAIVRNLNDILVSTRFGDCAVLDIAGKVCQCDWIQKDSLLTELRIRANNELVMSIRKEDVWSSHAKDHLPQVRLEIYPAVLSTYITRTYKDKCAEAFDLAKQALVMRQDILDEILIAYLLYSNFNERRIRIMHSTRIRLYAEGKYMLKRMGSYNKKRRPDSHAPVLPPIRHSSDLSTLIEEDGRAIDQNSNAKFRHSI